MKAEITNKLEMVVQWVKREERLKNELTAISSNNMPSTRSFKLCLMDSIQDCVEQREKLLNEVITLLTKCHE